MKRTFLFLCAITFCFIANRSLAQSFLEFIHIDDSTHIAHCQVPATVDFNVTTDVSDDLGGMTVTVTVFWGDGSDTTFSDIIPGFDQLISQVTHTYTTAGEYYTHGVVSLSNGMADTIYSSNPVVINTSCVHLSGYVYLDENQNCTYDVDDNLSKYPQLVLESANDTVALYYGYLGEYSFDGGANQNYTLHLSTPPIGTLPLCPNSFNYNFNVDTSDLQIDFALTCSQSIPDNQIQWAQTGDLPGDYAYLSTKLINGNCSPGSGTLTFELDSLHQYSSVFVNAGVTDTIPASVNGNIITFNFNNLVTFPFVNYEYNASLKLLVNPNALPGDSFCIDITVTPPDLDNTNNVKHMCGVIGGPFDPNHKRVSPLGVGEDAIVPPGTEFTYTVEFQNTGTAPAINIHVTDALDADFDTSTFQVTGSSHAMTYTLNQNALNFSFQNIMLPDSGSDEPGSHGWVSYKIKPKGSAPPGTVVTNTASIYFDNNPAVITNTTRNTFDDMTYIVCGPGGLNLLAYPNPARDEIQFSLPKDFQGDVEIRNMMGNLIWTHHAESLNLKLATNQFASGIYQMVASGGGETYSVRFAVVK